MTVNSKRYIKLSNHENYFNYFLLAALIICFVYRARQKAIKNLKCKYKKESLTKR